MKRNTVIAVVLCLMMITTAGAGAASAEQENPRQAGKSSIYFYDVESFLDNGYGKLVIDTKKKTFVFIGWDFTPNSHFAIKWDKANGYKLIGGGRSNPAGNLHIQGSWEGTVVPQLGTVGTWWYYDPAYGFMGQSLAGYVAHLKIRYSKDGGNTWSTTEKETGDISLGETYKITVAQFTDSTHVINKGDLIQLKARVVWGDDTWTDTIFTYVPDCDPAYCWPKTDIRGTAWDAWIEYYNDSCQYSLDPSDNYWMFWGVDIP